MQQECGQAGPKKKKQITAVIRVAGQRNADGDRWLIVCAAEILLMFPSVLQLQMCTVNRASINCLIAAS